MDPKDSITVSDRPFGDGVNQGWRTDLWDQRAVFAGKDPSRALATSSLKEEDCVPEWSDLEDKSKTVLGEWFTFFSKRYNIVGKVEGATNT